MDTFSIPIQLRWTDIDANRHVKHSSYYDFGAVVRMNFMTTNGLPVTYFEKHQTGIVLFREEAIFKREVAYDDELRMDVEITRSLPDYSRWSLRHHLYKTGDVLAAIVNVDGAWIDLVKRKIAQPGPEVQQTFSKFRKSVDYEALIPKQQPG